MLLQLHEPGQTPLPHQENRYSVGIDLGTTHSLVAHVVDNKAVIVVDKTPSVVAHDGNDFVVGEKALDFTNAIYSVKRLMANPGEKTNNLMLADKQITPVQASAEILKHLKKEAEHALKISLKEIVLTVPAYFDDTARTATRDAARIAGLEVVRMINEPTAAALAYGLEQDVTGLYGVYDLGGGTFDFSLLNLEQGVFQVIATGGDTHLGGDDIDQALQTIINYPLSTLALRTLKEELTYNISTTLHGQTLTQQKLNELAFPFIERTLKICEDVLKQAKITSKDLKGLVLVGGSSRMPAVQQAVEAFFHQKPLVNINPDEAIALGAAYQAHALLTGTGTLLLDVCPLSLGLEMMGGTVDKLIHRNSPIPTSVTEEFTTYQDNQTALLIHVVQGERDMVSDCRSLAKFVLQNIPAAPQGCARIDVTFTLDADGLLSVSALEKTTGVLQSIEVKPTYGLSTADIDQLIELSYTHAQADKQEKEKQEAKVEAIRLSQATETALAKDNDLLEASDREMIATSLKHLKHALELDVTFNIKQATQALEKATHNFAEQRLNRALNQAFKGTTL